MSELEPVGLVTAAIVNSDHELLLARKNHGWELPGTRISYQDNYRLVLAGALMNKLGIEVEPDADAMPLLTTVRATRAGVEFDAQIYRVDAFRGYPMQTRESGYTQLEWFNPFSRGLGRNTLSSIMTAFHERITNDHDLRRLIAGQG